MSNFPGYSYLNYKFPGYFFFSGICFSIKLLFHLMQALVPYYMIQLFSAFKKGVILIVTIPRKKPCFFMPLVYIFSPSFLYLFKSFIVILTFEFAVLLFFLQLLH